MRVILHLFACACLLLTASLVQAQDGGPATRWFAVPSLDTELAPAPGYVNRDTPQSMMEGYRLAAEREDWLTAAYYLDLSGVDPDVRARMGPVLAEMLYQVLQRAVWFDWSSLSDRPDALQENAPSDDPMSGEVRRSIRLALVDLPDRSVAIRINRLKPEGGDPVWVFSERTVAATLDLFQAYGPSRFERKLPTFLQETAFWTLKRWEVIALPLVFFAAVFGGYLTWTYVRRIKHRQPYRIVRLVLDAVEVPLALMAFVATFALIKGFVFTFSGPVNRLLGPFQALLFVVAISLIAVRIVDALLDRLVRDNIEELAEAQEADRRDLYTNISAVRRIAIMLAFLVGAALVLVQSNIASTLGFSLLASAGVIGIIVAFAARSVLSDIMASLQIAFAKTARIGDSVLWQGQWCTVERINFTYMQLRVWDNRRLIVPVASFVSETFENWTKQDARITKYVELRLDHRADVDALRHAFERFVAEAEDVIDKEEAKVQVVGHDASGMTVRFVADAEDPSAGWTLSCRLREAMLKAAARLEAENGGEVGAPAFLPREREMRVGNGEAQAAS